MKQQEPKYTATAAVKYVGWDSQLKGKIFKIESPPDYCPTYDPPGYYYDLTHVNLKRVPEGDLTAV